MFKFKIILNSACIFESDEVYGYVEDAIAAGKKKAKELYEYRTNPEVFGGILFGNETLDDFCVVPVKLDTVVVDKLTD